MPEVNEAQAQETKKPTNDPEVQLAMVRAALLATPNYRTERIEHNGVAFLVRQPTTESAEKVSKAVGSYDQLKVSIIESVFLEGPEGTLGAKVFKEQDWPNLKKQPQTNGTLMKKIVDALGRLTKVEELEAEAKKD